MNVLFSPNPETELIIIFLKEPQTNPIPIPKMEVKERCFLLILLLFKTLEDTVNLFSRNLEAL